MEDNKNRARESESENTSMWSLDDPREPGWYWYFADDWDVAAGPEALEVVWQDKEGGPLDVWTQGDATPVDKYVGFWMRMVVPVPPGGEGEQK